MKDKKKKSKLTISLDQNIIKKLEETTTNKSVFIEYAVLEYMKKNNIDISDIIL